MSAASHTVALYHVNDDNTTTVTAWTVDADRWHTMSAVLEATLGPGRTTLLTDTEAAARHVDAFEHKVVLD